MTTEKLPYGDHPAQHGTFHRPSGRSRGVVVVIHGGFWKAAYDATLGEPLARDLAARGWTAWNLEYRRVGDGGGWPSTFDDVAAGIEAGADTYIIKPFGPIELREHVEALLDRGTAPDQS